MLDTKHEVCSPFIPRRSALRKTSAEIVSEARQALRVQSTHRPFTPRDGQRRLFGRSSVGAERDSRPPSTFSLHAQNFDAPDSRPGSGTRLAPLDHKPKFPVACDAEDPSKAFPKPPTDPVAARRGLAGSRARLLRAGSLTTLPPVEGLTNGKEGKQSVPQLRRDARKESHILRHPVEPDGNTPPVLWREYKVSNLQQFRFRLLFFSLTFCNYVTV
uniref:Armadillo repeat-containing protein 2-like n=1 Tax=Stegastes partitus TaxID=144197 RepID=A0A3B5A5U7_9TELE